jgi:anti-anti-sigma regulatory factor
MQIQHSTQHGCLIVALTGSIDLSTVSQVQRALLKDLSTQPDALICDLSAVDVLDPVCATVFATVANHPASRWPTTSLLLCGAQPPVAAILGRLQVPHFLRLYPGVEDGLDDVLARPSYLRAELLLAPTPKAAAAARAFVRDTCQAWQVALADTAVLERAVLLADELVTTPWSTPAPRSGCGWSCAATGCTSRCAMVARGCCAWSPCPTRRPRAGAGCGWLSSWPAPGACTTIPTVARSCGAPSTCEHTEPPLGWSPTRSRAAAPGGALRAMDRRGRTSWRAFGRRRLRRQSELVLVATHGGAVRGPLLPTLARLLMTGRDT